MADNGRGVFIDRFFYSLPLILIQCLSIGCAFDLANIKPIPAEFIVCENECRSFEVTEDLVLINLFCGYARTIKKHTHWQQVGKISEGKIYKPVETCFTIECSNVFEAYLVLDKEYIVGFYLPVEKGFVPNKNPFQITKKEDGGA